MCVCVCPPLPGVSSARGAASPPAVPFVAAGVEASETGCQSTNDAVILVPRPLLHPPTHLLPPPPQVFTPSVFGEVKLVGVAAGVVAGSPAGSASSSGMQEFTAAQRAQRGARLAPADVAPAPPQELHFR